MNRKKRVVMSKLTTLEKAGRDFDLIFWKRVGASGKFDALWQMVLDYRELKKYGNQPRLQRHSASLKRRWG